MKELLRSNDVVLLSFAGSLLDEAGYGHIVLDTNMSITEGSIGIFPRRLCVSTDDWPSAKQLLIDAGLGDSIEDK